MWLGGRHRRLATLVVAAAVVASAQVAASAATIGAPQITRAKATHVGAQEATLKAKVNPGSTNATWEVLLRPASDRVAEPALVQMGVLTPGKSQSVSATAEKWEGLPLAADTRYTFTLVVHNATGRTQQIVPFKTKSARNTDKHGQLG